MGLESLGRFFRFDFATVSAFRPDFNHDVPRDLDTGGRNWHSIYRHLDRSRISFANPGGAVGHRTAAQDA